VDNNKYKSEGMVTLCLNLKSKINAEIKLCMTWNNLKFMVAKIEIILYGGGSKFVWVFY